VGSFNLDPLSLANLETLVEVADSHLVAQGEAWIQDHFVRSRPMTSVEASTWLHRWLLDPLGRLVARLVDMTAVVIASRKRRKAWAKKLIVGVPGLQASVPRRPRSR
jgi:cardiolipin synthase